MFYANYNIILFFYLLFTKTSILISNDLDTLLPVFLVSKIRKIPIVYDTHEYFTGVPELIYRPKVRNIWKKIENFIFPKLKYVYTVNHSIAGIYKKEYRIEINVVRNLPILTTNQNIAIPADFLAKINQLKSLKTTNRILYQGAINKDRGLEEMICAMAFINNAVLVIIGSGDIEKELFLLVETQKLTEKVIFIGQIPFHILPAFTQLATIGISLEKDTNINYKFASPNKVVDYIHAEIPVFAAQLTEIEEIINTYKVGKCIDSHEPQKIAFYMNEILENKNQLQNWRKNCQIAKLELHWGIEQEKLLQIFSKL